MGCGLRDPDVWWEIYGAAYRERTWRNYRWILSTVVRHGAGGPLLDVGCGLGFLVECARRFGMTAVGLDGSERALAECHRLHPLADVRPWRAGAELPLDEGSVGAVVVNEVADHLTYTENRHLLGEARRVLRPEGILLVNAPACADGDLGHTTAFSPGTYRALVESFSLEVIEQRFVPRPLLGRDRWGLLAMRVLSRFVHPESWAARIDLVARKPPSSAEADPSDRPHGGQTAVRDRGPGAAGLACPTS
jgi:SAM-dependent methyltransferase